MRAYGHDRCREVRGRWILHSRIPKAWTPRTPATLTHAEFPGTAVLWDDEYFEVVDATPLAHGGVRYVLLPWREDHTIRTFEAYDGDSERRRMADHELAQRQRKASATARWSGVVLGHLPAVVQEELQNRLGVNPSRMTLSSAVPPIALFGICVFLGAGALLGQNTMRIPIYVVLPLAAMAAESIIRMTIALSTTRGIGSVAGWIAYLGWWLATGRRGISPIAGRGESVAFTPPARTVDARDKYELMEPLLTLLPAAEQQQFARRWGFDYRSHANGVAAIVLLFASVGAWTSYGRFTESGSVSAIVSAAIASFVAVEQLVRFLLLRRGPAGSVLGLLVRLATGKTLRALLS